MSSHKNKIVASKKNAMGIGLSCLLQPIQILIECKTPLVVKGSQNHNERMGQCMHFAHMGPLVLPDTLQPDTSDYILSVAAVREKLWINPINRFLKMF